MVTNIFVISNLYPSKEDPFYGTFVKNFVDDISKCGRIENVDICVIRGRSYKLYTKIWKYIVFYLSIIYHLLFKKYDIVYVHIITHAALPLRLVSIFKKLPLIFNIHGEDLLTQTKLATYFLDLAKPLLMQSKLIVIPSFFFKQKVNELLPMIPETKLYVSASGGVSEIFYHTKSNEPNNIPIVGYVSRIDRGKGWDTFILGLSLLKENGFIFKAQIIGRGSEIPDMKKMIDDLQMNAEIDYIGPVEYNKLPAYYSNFDLFVFPTQLEESLGLVGLEAMACKVPVVGSKIGGLTDYIEEGINGYFFKPADAIDLCNQIKQFFNLTTTEKNKMKKAAYETALKYSSNSVSTNLISKIIS